MARRIGDFQARILLSLFYFVILGPFALVLRRRDPLAIAAGRPRGLAPRDAGRAPDRRAGPPAVLMNILGISCYFHDAAAALLQDGSSSPPRRRSASRAKKHDSGFPSSAIDVLPRAGGISAADLDYVVFYEKPFVKFERILLTCAADLPALRRVFREAMITWLGDKLWIKARHPEAARASPPTKILFSEHHLSHAASAFFCSPFDEAAILTVDGVGEWTTATLGRRARAPRSRCSSEIRFPHSLGLLYSRLHRLPRLRGQRGRVQGDGHGALRHAALRRRGAASSSGVADDGSFGLDMDYFAFHHSTDAARTATGSWSCSARRATRRSRSSPSASGYPAYFGPRPADYAAQCASGTSTTPTSRPASRRSTEEVVLGMARARPPPDRARRGSAWPAAWRSTASPTAASCARRRSRSSTSSRRPATPAARSARRSTPTTRVLGQPRGFVMEHASGARSTATAEVEAALDGRRASRYAHVRRRGPRCWTASWTALGQGQVVGWFQGRFEWGPRALGNRSILADPRRAEMKDLVNTKIKFREPFRPFAPSVLVDRAEDYFDAARTPPGTTRPGSCCYVDGRARGQARRRSRRSRTWTARRGCRPSARTRPRATTGSSSGSARPPACRCS